MCVNLCVFVCVYLDAAGMNEEDNKSDERERFLQLLATSNGVMRLVDVLQVNPCPHASINSINSLN